MKYGFNLLFLVIFVGVWQSVVLAEGSEEGQQSQEQQDLDRRTSPCLNRCLQGRPKFSTWSNNMNNQDSYSMYQAKQQQQQQPGGLGGQNQVSSSTSNTWFYYDNFINKCRPFSYDGKPTQKTLQTQNIHYSEASCIRSCEVPCNQRKQQLLDEEQQQGYGNGNGNMKNLRGSGTNGGGCFNGYCWAWCDVGGWCWTGPHSGAPAQSCATDRACSPHWGCISYCAS